MHANFNREELERWTADHRTQMIEELKNWVRHPSVSRADLAAPGAPYGPDCRKMLDYALQRGSEEGFAVQDADGYAGSISYGDGAEEIGLVCHLDVVPEGDGWIYAPYEPVETNGFLIGRGVGDNKGSAIASFFLLQYLREHGINLRHTVRILLGCAEETGMADFATYVKEGLGPVPQFSIVADGGFPVNYAHKGGLDFSVSVPGGKDLVDFKAGLVRNAIPDKAILTVRGITAETALAILKAHELTAVQAEESAAGSAVILTFFGKGGHAAGPENGDNAIVKAARGAGYLAADAGLDLGNIPQIADAFADYYGGAFGVALEDEISGKLTMNAGVIHSEDDHYRIEADIRYPVSCNGEEILHTIEANIPQYGMSVIAHHIAPPFYIDPESSIVKTLMSIYQDITGDVESKAYTMGGGTYSRVVPNAVTFGPSLPNAPKKDFLPEGHGGAHGPDEALNIDAWLTGFRIYVESVIRLDEIL